MKKSSLSALGLATAMIVTPTAKAQMLVEIFTAMACDVCRNAEEAVMELAKRDDVVAVSMHVDYWDYLENDPFADPAFGARQVGYNKAEELTELYTPQILFQGEAIGESPDFESLFQLADMKAQDEFVSADWSARSGGIEITLEALEGLPAKDYDVIWMRGYLGDEIKAIDEDTYAEYGTDVHLVKLIRSIGDWDGEGTKTINFELETPANGVLVVQERNLGKAVFAKSVAIED